MCEKKNHYNAYASSSLGQEMHPMNFFYQIQITKMLIHFKEARTIYLCVCVCVCVCVCSVAQSCLTLAT